MPVTRNCDVCGKPYTKPPSLVGKYCSRACRAMMPVKPDRDLKTRRTKHAPNHPLATTGGLVAEHRMVLWDKIGPGPHKCTWCGESTSWTVGERTARMLVPDHLDGDWRNNSAANLVPACMSCNAGRTRRAVGDDEVFVEDVAPNGAVTRTRGVVLKCPECGVDFIAKKGRAGRNGLARCCSRPCATRLQFRELGHPRSHR